MTDRCRQTGPAAETAWRSPVNKMDTTRYRPGTSMTASTNSLSSSGASWSNKSPKLVSNATSDVTSTTTSSITPATLTDQGQQCSSINSRSDVAFAATTRDPAAVACKEDLEASASSSIAFTAVAAPHGNGTAVNGGRSSVADRGNKRGRASISHAAASCSNSSTSAATAVAETVRSEVDASGVRSYAATSITCQGPTITLVTASSSTAGAFSNSIARPAGTSVAAAGVTSGGAAQESSEEQQQCDQNLEGGRTVCFNDLVIDCVDFSALGFSNLGPIQLDRTPTPQQSRGHYAGQHVWPPPLIFETFHFPPPLLSASPEPTDVFMHDSPIAQSTLAKTLRKASLTSSGVAAAAAWSAAPLAEVSDSMTPDSSALSKAWATAPAEVEEELPRDRTRMVRDEEKARPFPCQAPSLNCCQHDEPIACRPCGTRCPSHEELHTAAVQWPSMTLPDRGSLYTPPEARDAAAKTSQATWDAAHNAATMGPAILAPAQQRRRVSLKEATRHVRAEDAIAQDSPLGSPMHLSRGDSGNRIPRGQQRGADKDWKASTVSHVRRSRVVCQKAQSGLVRIASQDGPVFLRLYDDHLCRMDRMERHRAKVRPLS